MQVTHLYISSLCNPCPTPTPLPVSNTQQIYMQSLYTAFLAPWCSWRFIGSMAQVYMLVMSGEPNLVWETKETSSGRTDCLFQTSFKCNFKQGTLYRCTDDFRCQCADNPHNVQTDLAEIMESFCSSWEFHGAVSHGLTPIQSIFSPTLFSLACNCWKDCTPQNGTHC